MKILIPNDKGFVSHHFGHAAMFNIFTIKDDKIIDEKIIDSPGHKPGFLPTFFKSHGVDIVIADGIGEKAVNLFKEVNIEIFAGACGKITEVINRFLKGGLQHSQSTCKKKHSNDKV